MSTLFSQLLVAQTTIPVPSFGEGGFVGLATFLIAAWLNGWIVSGKQYKEDKAEAAAQRALDLKEIEYWRGLAMMSLRHAEQAVRLAENQITEAPK